VVVLSRQYISVRYADKSDFDQSLLNPRQSLFFARDFEQLGPEDFPVYGQPF
jgi:hypothetical protein